MFSSRFLLLSVFLVYFCVPASVCVCDDSIWDEPGNALCNSAGACNDVPNYTSVTQATQNDEDENSFSPQVDIALVYNVTQIFLRREGFSVGSVYKPHSYSRSNLDGIGPLWQQNSGIGGVWIDLRRGAEFVNSNNYPGSVSWNETSGLVSFTLNYLNQHDTPDIVHAHGIRGDYTVDGTPYISGLPMPAYGAVNYTYTINPSENSGTYFLHSHYGWNSVDGMSAPLIIQANVSLSYPEATRVNDPNTQDVLLYLEDWCLVYTNADDFETRGDGSVFQAIVDPALCQNPSIAYTAVWGEWFSNKYSDFITNGDIDKCLAPVDAFEFGFSYFLANDRTYEDSQQVSVSAGSNVRVRVINAARMSNWLVTIPPELESVVIAVDGNYITPTNMSSVWVTVANRLDFLVRIPASGGTFPIQAIVEAPDAATSNVTSFLPFEKSNVVGIVLYTGPTPPLTNLIHDTVPGIGMLSQHPDRLRSQEGDFSSFETWTWGPAEATKNFTLNLTGYNGIRGINKVSYQLPPMVPLPYHNLNPLVVDYGDRVCITLTNFNWDTHPIHLHGHRFKVVSVDGKKYLPNGPLRDTVAVPAGNCNTVVICFNADNQGGGAHGLHCHMAIHEMAGMFTTIEYSDYRWSTPSSSALFLPLSNSVSIPSSSSGNGTNGTNNHSLVAGLVVGWVVAAILSVALIVVLRRPISGRLGMRRHSAGGGIETHSINRPEESVSALRMVDRRM